jgi:HD-like signal output (HDOD) protein/ActR/RegA family two-component response regulator
MNEQPLLLDSNVTCVKSAGATSKRVLFVDDDQNVLDGIKRTLHGMRSEWQMAFSASGEEALKKLEQSEFDVIVTDMRMPGMNGSELLTEVLQRYPGMVRIVLSGTVEHDLVLRSATTAHQYLVKPCDAATLRATLDTALRIREILISPKLRSLVSRVTSLPSLPSVHAKLVESLENPEITSREMGEIIAQDVGMTAKLLQLANSAFFGLYRYVASPSEAAIYLGLDTIRALTLSTGVFSVFHQSGAVGPFIAQLQRHSIKVGMVAHIIAKRESLPKKICDSSLIGGLLHDVGKLVLAANCPKEYDEVMAVARKEGVTCHERERQVFGATHAEIGAYLLWLWGLPDEMCKAVAFHHRPAECSETSFTAAAAIHVADALEHEVEGAPDPVCRVEIDMTYLNTIALVDHVPEWRRLRDEFINRGEKA